MITTIIPTEVIIHSVFYLRFSNSFLEASTMTVNKEKDRDAATISDSILKDNLYTKEPSDTIILTAKTIGTDYNFKHQVVWKNAIGFLILHLACLWGWVLVFCGSVLWNTIYWS